MMQVLYRDLELYKAEQKAVGIIARKFKRFKLSSIIVGIGRPCKNPGELQRVL